MILLCIKSFNYNYTFRNSQYTLNLCVDTFKINIRVIDYLLKIC